MAMARAPIRWSADCPLAFPSSPTQRLRPISCDCSDEALATHPGSHLRSTLILHARSDASYDTPCFPAFVSWWQPYIDSHHLAPASDLASEVIEALAIEFRNFEGLAQSTARWAATRGREINLAEAARALVAAQAANPTNAYLTGQLSGFDAARMQVNPALHPLLAHALSKAGHVIYLDA